MAWECALENSIATLIGPVFVAKLALAFGYTFGEEEESGKSIPAATALGQAMAADGSVGRSVDVNSAKGFGPGACSWTTILSIPTPSKVNIFCYSYHPWNPVARPMLQATICIPWCVTFALYTLLHLSYPADMRRLKA